MVAHQQRLVEKILKIERPVEAFQAACKRAGMTNRDDNLAIQSSGKPGRGKDSKWIFQQHALTAHQPIVKDEKVAPHAQEIPARADRTDFIPKVVVKFQQFLESPQKPVLVLFTNILIPALHLRMKNTGTVQNVQRLTDVSRHGIGREHFANPRCAAAMCPCDQNWSKRSFIHTILLTSQQSI